MGNSSTDDSSTDGDAPASNSSLYSDGEKVLAYHNTRFYEAKATTLPFLFSNLLISLSSSRLFQILFPFVLI
jgi:hypothetical protein